MAPEEMTDPAPAGIDLVAPSPATGGDDADGDVLRPVEELLPSFHPLPAQGSLEKAAIPFAQFQYMGGGQHQEEFAIIRADQWRAFVAALRSTPQSAELKRGPDCDCLYPQFCSKCPPLPAQGALEKALDDAFERHLADYWKGRAGPSLTQLVQKWQSDRAALRSAPQLAACQSPVGSAWQNWETALKRIAQYPKPGSSSEDAPHMAQIAQEALSRSPAETETSTKG